MYKNLHIMALLLILGVGAKAQFIVRDTSTAPSSLSDTAWLRKRSFFPLPVLGYSQEKGLEIGLAMLYSFYTDNKNPDRLTRNSTLSLIPAITTEHQFKVDLKSNIWTQGNKWHIKSNLRYHNFPLYFFGIGDTTHYADRSLLNNTRYKVQVEGERLVGGNFYVGASVLYQYDTYSSKDNKGIYNTLSLVDKDGGYVTFIGLTGVFDNRDKENYTRRGWWLKLNVAYAPSFLSKQPLFKLDAQGAHFIPISRKSTLGLNGIIQTLQGDNLPFYLLPEMGNDNMMRGYYTGRYRNQNYMAGQAEYRYLIDPKLRVHLGFIDLKPKFALAAFAGTGTVFANHDFHFSGLKPSAGVGVRYFYDESSRLTIRIDYAVGEKHTNEPRQKGFYLSLAEAF
ncbi:polymerase [Chitinophaga silvatica]|uniref:Polymerase n=2 Tax=Chitinophaga silvatica TaxID=2282649 RepID=A0A3E1Y3D8_9BACT|nr:polymerase [Chitinophaga silvatica]